MACLYCKPNIIIKYPYVCKNYKTCPFSGVIFADDAEQFGDLSRYAGTSITLTGKRVSYEGRAEIVLSSPSQLSQ